MHLSKTIFFVAGFAMLLGRPTIVLTACQAEAKLAVDRTQSGLIAFAQAHPRSRHARIKSYLYDKLHSLPLELIMIVADYEEYPYEPWTLQGKVERVLATKSQISALETLGHDQFACGSHAGIMTIWDATTGQCLQETNEHSTAITRLIALANSLLISASTEAIIAWSYDEHEKKWRCTAKISGTKWQALKGLPNGHLAGLVKEKKKFYLVIWNGKLQQISCMPLDQTNQAPTTLELLPESRELVVGGTAPTLLRGYNIDTLQPTQAFETSNFNTGNSKFTCPARVISLMSLPNNLFATCMYGPQTASSLIIWDATTRKYTYQRQTDLEQMACLSDGTIAEVSYPNITIVDAPSGAEKKQFGSGIFGVTALLCLPDGRLVSGHTNAELKVWA